MHHRPLSTSSPDLVRWLAEDRADQRPLAAHVALCCEGELANESAGDMRAYILRFEWDQETPAAERAKRTVADLLYERIYKSADRPVGFGPLQWFLLAWRVYRMISTLVDLWFECREFLEVSYARGFVATRPGELPRPVRP